MKACKRIKKGTVTQLWTFPNEQGFVYRQQGVRDQVILEFEGLGLLTRYPRPPKGVAKSNRNA